MLPGRTIGRYVLFDEIGHGGMATVHIGRLLASGGFSRTVAIKRLHPHCARDPQFTTLFLDEARLTARIQHPNVVAALDVVHEANAELLLVMEYIHGLPLSRLAHLSRDQGARVAPRVAVAIAAQVLHGLHAAHEATTESGQPLGIIHRDVTPQNILVGADGVTRLVDFGVAKAASRLQVTGEGQIKGKFAYMAPEQVQAHPIDRRVDVYAAAVVLWETLTGKRLFTGDHPAAVVTRVLEMDVDPPSKLTPDVPKALDAALMKGLSRDARERYPTAAAMAQAIEEALAPATAREVSQWVRGLASDELAARSNLLSTIESAPIPAEGAAPSAPPPSPPPDGSQISNISVTLTPRKSTPVALFAVIAIALAAGVGAWLFAHGTARRSTVAAPPPPMPPVATTLASAVAPTPSHTAVDLPPITATRHVAPPPAKPSASSRPNCNPPYTIDPADPRIHVAKPECL